MLYKVVPKPICFKLLIQPIALAFSLALFKAGSNIAAKMAIIAMTTKSSMRVKECRDERLLFLDAVV